MRNIDLGNIKMDLKETVLESVDWIDQSEDTFQWKVLGMANEILGYIKCR
jgi:hypothetical protein